MLDRTLTTPSCIFGAPFASRQITRHDMHTE